MDDDIDNANMKKNSQDDDVECSEDDDKLYWNLINMRSVRRFTSTQKDATKMKKLSQQYRYGLQCLQSMNRDLEEYLQELYSNENELSSNKNVHLSATCVHSTAHVCIIS